MVGVLEDAWRYWGPYFGSAGSRLTVLGALWWEHYGTHGGNGVSP